MKLNKTATALALAMGVASAAQAQSVYITGSTAFRAQIYQALTDLHVTSVQAPNSNTKCYQGTVKALNDYTGLANNSAGNAVTAYLSFNGSGGGIATIANEVQINYVNAAGTTVHYPLGADVTFSDVNQTSTTVATANLPEVSSADGQNDANGTGVAIVCWCWAASADCAGSISNITPGEMTDLFKNGSEFQSIMEGNPNATNNPNNGMGVQGIGSILLSGRSWDSGTRITAELLAGYDPAKAIPTVYTINGVDASVPNGTFQVDNQTDEGPAGFSGYTSGGNVALALTEKNAGTAVSYVAFTDCESYGSATSAYTPLANGAIPVSFWGANPLTGPVTAFVANTATGVWNFAGIESGEYPYWSYEHCYYSPHDAAGSWVIGTFLPDLLNELEYEIIHPQAGYNQAADLISNMQVHRAQDGGPILQGN